MKPESISRKKRIAILGGGPAGLVAAHELTRYPGWQERYEVVVYQLGWRLGGKCATGRGPNGRIEEHGIHIFQGWYHNAFRMVRQIYDERREQGLAPSSPFQHWREAFDKTNSTLLTEYRADQGKWLTRAVTLPSNRKVPGEGPDPTWVAIQDIVRRALAAVMEADRHLREAGLGEWLLRQGVLREHAGEAASQDTAAEDRARSALFAVLDRWRDSRVSQTALAWGEKIQQLLGLLLQWLERASQRFLSESLRWRLVLLDLTYATLKGVIRDVFDVRTGKFDYEAINHLDYREWLARHGAREMTRYSSVVRFVYAGTYAYLNDGGQGGGLLAAGSVVRAMIAAMSYRDSLVWLFKAGTGDTLIMPLYQVLASRGVEFRFFHRVRDVHWSDTGDIEEVSVGRQVTLRGPSYDPRVAVTLDPQGGQGGGRVLDAWPNRPLQEQIVEDVTDADLETPWSSWQDAAELTLRKGEDFDQIILAIPVAALADVCSEIVARDQRWRDMVTHVETTATHSFQLWLRPSLEELGMRPRDWGLPDDVVGTNTVTYAHMGKSWTDMSPIIDLERWPAANRPRTLLYLTGVLSDDDPIPGHDDHGFPERQRLRVMYLAEQWMHDHMGYFFPRGTRRGHPSGMDLGLLVDWERDAGQRGGQGSGQKAGPPRLSSQYFRANVDPSERYTLAKPSPRKYRLRTGDSGFGNLFLAGDWIDYGLNMGFFEGAIISGLQAAQAVMKIHYGFEDYDPILGEQDVSW